MIGGAASWILSALFAGTGTWSLAGLAGALRGRGPGSGEGAVGAGLHALMSVGMVSMFWSWGAAVPPIALIVAFTGAAAWFAGRALLVPVSVAACVSGPGAGAAAGVPAGGAALRPGHWYHAAMMAAMVWMAVAISVPATVASGPAASAALAAEASMAGMSMGAAPAGGAALGPPGWVVAVCLAAGLAFSTAAAWYGVAVIRRLAAVRGLRRAVLQDVAGATAAAGMAAALLLMA